VSGDGSAVAQALEEQPVRDEQAADPGPQRAAWLERAFQSEPPQPSGRSFESNIEMRLRALPKMVVDELSCRSVTCKLSARFPSADDYTQAYHRLFISNSGPNPIKLNYSSAKAATIEEGERGEYRVVLYVTMRHDDDREGMGHP
jgi:hypothetical protein